jgi:tyrosine-specific transport protein
MGYYPSLAMLVLFWLFMTCSAFCVLEAHLWTERDTDFLTMARLTLGKGGEAACWFFYLFLLYALSTLYIALSSQITLDVVVNGLHFALPVGLAPIPMLVIFIYMIYQGPGYADLFNRILMSGLVVSYLVLCFLVAPHVHVENLGHVDWSLACVGMSVIATSFGYHIVIPSLCSYLERDTSALIKVLLLGGFIPLVVNVIWQGVALGVLPVEALAKAYEEGTSSALAIKDVIGEARVTLAARALSFFAITTSFLGVSLSLFHFLADALPVKKGTVRGRSLLSLLTFLPPLSLVWVRPSIAFVALDYAGVLGVVLLLGIVPVMMVYSGRYRLKLPYQGFQVPGGKGVLFIALLFGSAVIVLEVAMQLGYKPLV